MRNLPGLARQPNTTAYPLAPMSEGQLMRINTPNLVIEWNGSHTANVYNYVGKELDVFTF